MRTHTPYLFLCLLLLLSIPDLHAQETPRRVLDLSGTWEIKPDETAADAPKDQWIPAIVPAAWETALGVDFNGKAAYRKRFRVPENKNGVYLLRFHGAATEARVFVNGKPAGSHTGPWTVFTFDITDKLTPAERSGADTSPALITVRLDEKVGHNTQGFLPIIAPHFGGIWQKVELILTSSSWLDGTSFRVTTPAVDPESRTASLKAEVPIRGALPVGATVLFSLSPCSASPGKKQAPVEETVSVSDGKAAWSWKGTVDLWEPQTPNLYLLTATLKGEDGTVYDRVRKRFGFRSVTTRGAKLLLNEKETIIRGVLCWGYYPPLIAPNVSLQRFRERVAYFRSCGFNLMKFCLWLPPQKLLDVLDEEGMLCWIEYPTWHAKFDQAHKEALLREYTAMAEHDSFHPSAVLRSITCETGPSADLDVLRAIYTLLKERCPNTLVEDDSSWISWNRIHDVWDDHTYWNNNTWRAKLASLHRFRTERTMKPLLLGEAIAADTWINTKELLDHSIDAKPWWAPNWLDHQVAFELQLQERFQLPGISIVEDIRKTSLDYAMAMRRWQVETYRELLPHAGYVISTERDVTLCNMGLLDQLDRPKWTRAQWSWHGAHTRSLPSPGDQRAIRASAGLWPACRDAGFTISKKIRSCSRPAPVFIEKKTGARRHRWKAWALPEPAPLPAGIVLYGTNAAKDLAPLFPEARSVKQNEPIPPTAPALITYTITKEVMSHLENGGRIFHITENLRGSFREDHLWFLRGTAWAPPAPRAFFADVPRGMLSYLQLFELASHGVVRGEKLWEQVDPLLSFLETHDLDRVRPNLLLFTANAGKGTLTVSALHHTGGAEKNYAGLWLARHLVHYLLKGPRPSRSLNAVTMEALKTSLTAEDIIITSPWRFKKDPESIGVEKGWFKQSLNDKDWLELKSRSAEEGKIWNSYDGWGWYRQTIPIPERWKGEKIQFVFDSIDDMYILYINGKKAGGYGKMDRSESSFLQRTSVDVTEHIKAGKNNHVTLRIYDWVGSGGLNGRVWLTTGPAEKELEFLKK